LGFKERIPEPDKKLSDDGQTPLQATHQLSSNYTNLTTLKVKIDTLTGYLLVVLNKYH
jgi:hypothetical protein